MPRGSPGEGLLDPFPAFLGIRFRGRFWVIPLMTRGGLGEPPGSLNLRGSATSLTRQRSPSRGAANPVGFAQTAAALALPPETLNRGFCAFLCFWGLGGIPWVQRSPHDSLLRVV